VSDKQNDVEQRLMVGLHGTPELKPDEKVQYLGQFRERILIMLTKNQVYAKQVYHEVEEALKDPRSSRLILNGDLAFEHRSKYIKIAREFDKPYTVVNDPSLKGNVGLMVVADHAVDEENIEVE
jgi:uncharacterized protein YueI